MKLILTPSLLILTSHLIFGQAVPQINSDKPMTLKERYSEMKLKTETFNEYKVIKEYQLDREWKVIYDSIAAVRQALRTSNGEIKRLEGELKQTQDLLHQKEESIAPLELAGSHINFIGINFNKALFITMVLIITGALLALIGAAAWRLKNMQSLLSDRVSVINDVNAEFEEYRRKALDKQTKLSRELQNERNKLQETRRPEGSGSRHP